MSVSQIFKKIVIPCAAGVTTATESHTFGRNCGQEAEPGTKPSELPIYSKDCNVCKEEKKETPPPSSMEECVGNIRKELWVWQDNLKGYRHKIVDVYRKGFSKADSVIDYLREPAHSTQRIGAIFISGLAGYIMGLKYCGKMRRITYGAGGATVMAAICYPNEAADYFESAVLEMRRCFIVAYHFINGESPKMPEWLEKFVGSKGAAGPETVAEIKSETVKPDDKVSALDLQKILGTEEEKKKK